VLVGRAQWLKDNGVPDDFMGSVDLNETEGFSLIFIAREGRCQASARSALAFISGSGAYPGEKTTSRCTSIRSYSMLPCHWPTFMTSPCRPMPM